MKTASRGMPITAMGLSGILNTFFSVNHLVVAQQNLTCTGSLPGRHHRGWPRREATALDTTTAVFEPLGSNCRYSVQQHGEPWTRRTSSDYPRYHGCRVLSHPLDHWAAIADIRRNSTLRMFHYIPDCARYCSCRAAEFADTRCNSTLRMFDCITMHGFDKCIGSECANHHGLFLSSMINRECG